MLDDFGVDAMINVNPVVGFIWVADKTDFGTNIKTGTILLVPFTSAFSFTLRGWYNRTNRINNNWQARYCSRGGDRT